mmetsp:Transcript_2258/g.3068  ORF Transcript_2258/g.3068 Transcript_2258/m.3068 type:complete len:415 (+) Transcript_2258:333-1577(+)
MGDFLPTEDNCMIIETELNVEPHDGEFKSQEVFSLQSNTIPLEETTPYSKIEQDSISADVEVVEEEQLSSPVAKKPFRRRGSSAPKRTRIRSINGPVALSDEEAFYLSINGHMRVFRGVQGAHSCDSSEEVGLDELWTTLCAKNSKFPAKYKVYSFFREQRFVVRSGMHFGVDFAVYRLLPTHCHSELCVAVLDQAESELGCRHLATLTRVMPDVMKLLLLCYVLPVAWSSSSATSSAAEGGRGEYLRRLFPERTLPGGGLVDCSSYRCLEQLTVRPVTVIVRRSSATSKSFAPAAALQQRYRRVSVLKKPRLGIPSHPRPAASSSSATTAAATSTAINEELGEVQSTETPAAAAPPLLQKRRRDPLEVRTKVASKSNQLWAALATDGQPELSPKSKKRAKKRKWLIKMFGHSK